MHDDHQAPGAGHNRAQGLQWQTPHLPQHHTHEPQDIEPDLDLVEAAFLEAFQTASDPTSFLRLAGIPFKTTLNGQSIHLIRVDMQHQTDIASVTPLLGGGGHRVAPLPASHVGQRRTLRFTYLADTGSLNLTLVEAKALKDETPAR